MIIISLVIVIQTSVIKYKLEDQVWKLNSAFLENKFRLSDITENQLLALNTEGFSLSDSIRKIIPDNACVLRLHTGVCLSCHAENLLRLKKMLDSQKKIKLFVLGSYSFEATLKEELSAINCRNVEFVNISTLEIIPADESGQPYLFVLNENGLINNLFFCQKAEYDSLEGFLHSIERINGSQK